MKRIMFWCVCFVVFTPQFLLAADYWLARYTGPAVMGIDIPTDIAVDAEGNVYVTGISDGGTTWYDWATVKYDTNGSQLWVARYTNGIMCTYCNVGNESANALAVDKDGNVYVTGLSGGDYVTIKYNNDGKQLWVARYNNGGYDLATAIVVDSSGNVYVTGGSWYGANAQPYYYATVKYDNNGNQLWVRREHSTWDFYPPSLVVDNTGNVYVAGFSGGAYLIKYDTGGDKLWERRYDSGTVTGLSIDNNGIYINTSRYTTIKYDKDGNQIWIRSKQGQWLWNRDYSTSSVTVDGVSNVYVTGNVRNDDGTISVITTKYDTNGGQLHSVRYDSIGPSPWGGWDYPTSITVDKQGNAYVATTGYDANLVTDYLVISYDTNGNEQWVAKYNGISSISCRNNYDLTTAITVDNVGNVYVIGGSLGPGTFYDYVTVKNPQYLPRQSDFDGDGLPDDCDPDDDNDGVSDTNDICPFENALGKDANNDGCIDSVCALAGVVNSSYISNHGIKTSLTQRAENACKMYQEGKIDAVKGMLGAFIYEVTAQQGKNIDTSTADMLIGFASNALSGL